MQTLTGHTAARRILNPFNENKLIRSYSVRHSIINIMKSHPECFHRVQIPTTMVASNDVCPFSTLCTLRQI